MLASSRGVLSLTVFWGGGEPHRGTYFGGFVRRLRRREPFYAMESKRKGTGLVGSPVHAPFFYVGGCGQQLV